MRIRWTQPAVSDLTAICDYLETHKTPAFAETVAHAIPGAACSLAHLAKQGRPGREPDTREMAIQKHPHISVYAQRAGTVEILRVPHTSRQWP